MKLPRNAKIFSGQLDAAPFAAIFFLLVLFVLLGLLVYTPGVKINLPIATDLPGTDQAVVAVAVDQAGKFYFDNQLLSEALLKTRLAEAVKKSTEPLTLLVQADKTVSYETIIHLSLLARDAGMKEAVLATLPQTATVSP
jgi:biopolymer transport protein ExbD